MPSSLSFQFCNRIQLGYRFLPQFMNYTQVPQQVWAFVVALPDRALLDSVMTLLLLFLFLAGFLVGHTLFPLLCWHMFFSSGASFPIRDCVCSGIAILAAWTMFFFNSWSVDCGLVISTGL